LFTFVNLAQIVDNPARTLLVLGGISVGVALMVAIEIINVTALTSFRRSIEAIAGPADLQVRLGMGEVGFPEVLFDDIRDQPGIDTAVPVVRGTVSLAADPSFTLQLFGTDLVAEETLERYKVRLGTRRTDAAEALVDPASIFLTEALAQNIDVHVGDTITLLTPTGARSLTIRGLLQPGGPTAALGGQLAVMDFVAAQELLDKEFRLDQIDVVVDKNSTSINEVRAQLRRSLPNVLSISRPELHGAEYDRVLASFQAMLSALSLLCLVAGLFIVYNTTSTAVLRRIDAFATMRLIGASTRTLYASLIGESALLGICGSIIGIGIGVPLAWMLSGTITSSMGVIFQLRFPFDRLSINPLMVPVFIGIGTTTTVFASSFASRRIANVDPLSAVRSGALAVPTGRSSLRLILWWTALVAVSIACFYFEDRYKSIAWGNFGSTLWNAAVVVIAIPLMRVVAQRLMKLLPRWFGPPGTIAAGSLLRSENRAGVTVAAIALIITIATLLSSLVLSCRQSLAGYFAGFLASDLTVSAMSTEGGWLETPLAAFVGDQLRDVDGVTSVAAARVLSGQKHGRDRIAILALDPALFAAERAPSGYYRQGKAAEAAPKLQSGQAVNVSTSFSDRFSVNAGGTIELDSPNGRISFDVAGVVPDYVSDRGSVIMSRSLLDEHWHDSSVNRFLVSVDPEVGVDAVRDNIRHRIGNDYALKILSTGELLKYHTDQIDRAFSVMNSVQLLVIIVTIAGIFDLLISRILERRTELAIWQVIGAGPDDVRNSVTIESVSIGLIGVVLGIVVGAITSWLWVSIHFRELLGYYVEFHFATGAMIWYVTLVVVTTFVAGRAAAVRATRLNILDGIRAE
jgi:putative ABC transport system permease protein